ncbi:MAG: calcium/sodium antiporter [Alphaproteobacteria bacterium]|jgi:cation:H+ antiporter|nr:calcium/sodium antiporter [Alphaproteobacteria bacterium]MDC3311314.1 calcium/sodium antiporter [Alphaproteobacteria bacterium]
MIISILMLCIGLAILLTAAHFIIPGTISVANHFRIPPHVIAVLLIAAGTSAPELIVAIQAALYGSPQIVWGNIIGSNITNILVVLSIAGLFFPISTLDNSSRRDMYVLLVVTAVIALSAYVFQSLPLAFSVILIVILASYTLYLVRQQLNDDEVADNTEESVSLKRSVIYCIGGVVGLVLGADLIVKGSVDLALALSISKTVIGLTIVAFGTSLPEIAAAIASLIHKRTDMALGSIIGSNIFNITAGLGITRLFSELPLTSEILTIGLPIMLLSTLILAGLIILKQAIAKLVSSCFLIIYIIFLGLNMGFFS